MCFWSLREAVSEEDGVNSRQENILMMGQDTNVMASSQSQQLAPRCTSTTLEENDITNDGLVRNLKKVNHYIHCLLIDYLSLVSTKSVDSNLRMSWLAPITENILGYSMFCDRSQDMASRFKTFSVHGIWAINEAVVQTNTKKAMNFGFSVFTGR